MAKQSVNKGIARIRFIMVDAEIPDGDLSQITTAIQNALKPAAIVQHRVLQGALPQHAASTSDSDGFDSTDDLGEQDDSETVLPPIKPRAQRSRRPTTPDVLDLDMNSGTSLVAFASQHAAQSELDRNLIVAAWFKEHRDTAAITAAHIYTGYRVLGWPAGFEDFAWPLRALKKDKFMTSPGRGEYVVNHLGLDRVRKMVGA